MVAFLYLRQCFRLENDLRESKTFGNRSKTRSSDEVNRKCYFFCEGQETEPIYFAKLKDMGCEPCVCFAHDTPELMRKAIDLGVTMFTCNDPEKAIKILRGIGAR